MQVLGSGIIIVIGIFGGIGITAGISISRN